jgi:hypothetical protein
VPGYETFCKEMNRPAATIPKAFILVLSSFNLCGCDSKPVNAKVPMSEDSPITFHEDNDPEIAKLLKDHLEKGIETVKSTDDSGRTPLHLEALYGRRHSVQVLLDYGADPSARCNRGWTPRDYANSLEWTEVGGILETAEARAKQSADGNPINPASDAGRRF